MTKLIGTYRDYANVPTEDSELTVKYKLHTFTLIQLIHSPNFFFFELMLPSGSVVVLTPYKRLVKFLGNTYFICQL